MRLLPLALLAAALAGLALACSSGSGSDSSASLIHRLLLAAGSETSGDLESFAGRLPDGLPATPPQYPNAKLIVSSRQPAPVQSTGAGAATPAPGTPRPLLYFIVLDTADARSDVFDYYTQTLDKAPWHLDATFSSQQLDTLQFVDANDADITGAVSVAGGGADGHTSILISLQDAGAFVDATPAYHLRESLPAPKQLPPEVPAYHDATITQTAFLRQADRDSLLVVFLTRDKQTAVIEFYRRAFQANGWSVLDGAPFGLAQRIDFQDSNGNFQGSVIADTFTQDGQYVEVRVQVQLKPGAATPVPTSTAALTPATSPAAGQATP